MNDPTIRELRREIASLKERIRLIEMGNFPLLGLSDVKSVALELGRLQDRAAELQARLEAASQPKPLPLSESRIGEPTEPEGGDHES